ncbi:hypothetical protein DXX93_14110 [Thalassotalea euphylliae]|uniref:Uncharacterized protein n=1 Tax=Thalassotalea euphylliae TaxID=1655234 RepID=A0A3E0TUF0_9GAMM|nr:hypothetical protein DXX93_14110 [Thalassotalea euphylliae]
MKADRKRSDSMTISTFQPTSKTVSYETMNVVGAYGFSFKGESRKLTMNKAYIIWEALTARRQCAQTSCQGV